MYVYMYVCECIPYRYTRYSIALYTVTYTRVIYPI